MKSIDTQRYPIKKICNTCLVRHICKEYKDKHTCKDWIQPNIWIEENVINRKEL